MKLIEIDLEGLKLPELRHPLSKLTIINSDGTIEEFGGPQKHCDECGCEMGSEGIYHLTCKNCRS